MSCRRLHRNRKLAGWWHRQWCAECRDARSVDAVIARGIAQMQAEPASLDGLAETLTALGLAKPAAPTNVPPVRLPRRADPALPAQSPDIDAERADGLRTSSSPAQPSRLGALGPSIDPYKRPRLLLVELLLAAGIAMIVAAVVFPIFLSPHGKARQTSCFSNCKQLASALSMYMQDYDNVYPLAVPNDGTRWWNGTPISTPPDWRPGSPTVRALDWANAIQPYAKSYAIYSCPVASEKRLDGVDYAASHHAWANVTYTMNGLLQSYRLAEIEVPAQNVLLWEGMGKVQVAGFALANPQLDCPHVDKPCRYVPRPDSNSAPCASGNGGKSILYRPYATLWVHDQGANFVYSDGHARWLPLGNQKRPPAPNTPGDPFSDYDNTGYPSRYGWNGCHPGPMFRPDYVSPDTTSAPAPFVRPRTAPLKALPNGPLD